MSDTSLALLRVDRTKFLEDSPEYSLQKIWYFSTACTIQFFSADNTIITYISYHYENKYPNLRNNFYDFPKWQRDTTYNLLD